MKKYFFLALFVLYILNHWTQAFAEDMCPVFKDEPLLSYETIASSIEACKEARVNGTTATIENFSCPAWEFTDLDSAPITDERLSYYIASNLLMNEVDKKVKLYMQSLQDLRNKNWLAWTDALRSCISTTAHSPAKTISEVYTDICNPIKMIRFISGNNPNMHFSTEVLPSMSCNTIAQKKIAMWSTVWENLMISGMYKSFENDRDAYMSSVQWKYAQILEKFHTYQKIIFRAAAKIGVYIIQTVK